MSIHWKLKRRSQRASGFTLVELILSIAVISLIFGSLAWMSVGTVAIAQRVTGTATLQSQARLAVDQMTRDIHGSDLVMSSSGGYASGSQTLVLETPSYSNSGVIIAGQFDHIIYHLVGASAPYTLNRIVNASSSSVRASSADRVIARNVQALRVTCLVVQPVTGADGTTTRFGLAAQVAGTGAGLVKGVTQNGTALSLTTGTPGAGQVQFIAPSSTPSFPQGSLSFGTAPATTDTTDAVFSADPSDSTSMAQIGQVAIDLRVGTTSASLGPSGTESVEMAATTNLHNH